MNTERQSGAQRRQEARRVSPAAPPSVVQRGRPRPPARPRIFTERWFGKKQALRIAGLAAKAPAGAIIEIGCWEGYSTYHIANAVYPRTLYAIDHWQGNLEERIDHPSVIAARARNVYEAFTQNMLHWTKGNVIAIKDDWRSALLNTAIDSNIAFVHIDAAHDYASVMETLLAVYPRIVDGGVLCGDDYRSAHAGRKDLQGGVERAVGELCAAYTLKLHVERNGWWIVKKVPPHDQNPRQ